MSRYGLIYPSDYAYAVLAEDCPRNTTLNYLYNNRYNDVEGCTKKNWLSPDGYGYWTITPNRYSNNHADQVRFITPYGHLSSTAPYNRALGVRPSFFLKSTVKVLSGSGTEDDPYIVGL